VPASRVLLAGCCWLFSAVAAFAGCESLEAKGLRYTACSFAPGEAALEIRNLDRSGEPYRYLSGFAREVAQDGKRLRFAMNAGMFDDNQRPIGYYVEAGKMVKKLNRRNGGGNFHLKPNGVFYVKDGKAGVMETDAFAKSGVKPDYASQSGPMLVVNGKIHPKFSPTGTSRKLRNGVGVDDQGVVTFVISENAVTFWEFASLFKDDLKSRNALFFDGSVSSLYAPEVNRNDGFLPLGPMVGAIEIK
jgi:prepilin-type processing-associated H-X9-DG protein